MFNINWMKLYPTCGDTLNWFFFSSHLNMSSRRASVASQLLISRRKLEDRIKFAVAPAWRERVKDGEGVCKGTKNHHNRGGGEWGEERNEDYILLSFHFTFTTARLAVAVQYSKESLI